MKLKLGILSILILVAACTSTTSSGNEYNDVVLFNFVPNMPPTNSIYEGQNFRVGLELTNLDEEEKNVNVCVRDIIGDFSGGIPANVCRNVKLDPAYMSQDKLIGSKTKEYFPDREGFYNYEDIRDDQNTNVFVELYYKHKTIATSQICIKRDVDIEPQGIECEMSSQEKVINNNAPIKVTGIRKQIIPGGNNEISLRLEFDIKNVGSGKIINAKELTPGGKSTGVMDFDLYLDRGDRPVKFECFGTENNKIIFKDKENQKTIICESIVKMEDEFTTEIVRMIINYGYKLEGVTNNIKIIDKDI